MAVRKGGRVRINPRAARARAAVAAAQRAHPRPKIHVPRGFVRPEKLRPGDIILTRSLSGVWRTF